MSKPRIKTVEVAGWGTVCRPFDTLCLTFDQEGEYATVVESLLFTGRICLVPKCAVEYPA